MLVILLGSLVLALAAFVLQTRHQASMERYMLLAGEQRAVAHRIASYAAESAVGSEAAFEPLKENRNEFGRMLDELKNGVPEKGLAASPETVQPQLQEVESVWLELRSQVDALLNNRETILSLRSTVEAVRGTMPALLAAFTSVADGLVEGQAPQAQVYYATRQLFVTQRMDSSLDEVLVGGLTGTPAIERLTRDANELKSIVHALLKGDATLDISPVGDEIVQQGLLQASVILGDLDDLLQKMPQARPEGLAAPRASGEPGTGDENQAAVMGGRLVQGTDMPVELAPISDTLSRKLSDLSASYAANMSNPMLGPLEVKPALITLLGAAAIGLMLILTLVLIVNAKRRARFSSGREQQSEAGIQRLLDDIRPLAGGDLTVEAAVADDVSGAIAISLNQAVEAIREPLCRIRDTSAKLYASVQENRSSIMQLAEVSEHQREQIRDVSSMIDGMARDLTALADDVAGSSEAAEKSVELAARGGNAVGQTISGISRIGDQVQEASVSIRRLHENLQEAGEMVESIEDIADQTNILGLNAAMQAAVAGEQGRGFMVVAEGVQKQAERFASVSKQIEAMVQNIQAEAERAVNSMESGRSAAVSGAAMAEDAGKIMGQIGSVSQSISGIVSRFAKSLQLQSRSAVAIDDSMGVIREITRQNGENADASMVTIDELAENIEGLRRSVSGFVLPDRK